MGLLGRSFASKLKTITTLAVSRIVILKNQHKARASYARSDVSQLLNLGYHDDALSRVEHWITEQNMLDAFAMIENYCNFLRERAGVLEKNQECPVELKEATSSLIFASSRCGEFPELHKIREILTSKFGKEFADQAVELHKNNRVNSKMIQKLSHRRLSLQTKMNVLKQIASEIGVTLRLEQDPTLKVMDKLNVDGRRDEVEGRKCSTVDAKHKENTEDDPANIPGERLSGRNEEKKRYNNTTTAAEEALESESSGIEANKHSNHRVSLGKVHVHPMVTSSSKQEEEVISKSNRDIELKELERRETREQIAWEKSHLSPNPRDNMTTSSNAKKLPVEQVEEDRNREGNMVGELGSATMDNINNDYSVAAENEHLREERVHPSSHSIKWNPQRSHADTRLNPMVRRPVMETTSRTSFPKQMHNHDQQVDWKMKSVRTR